jgi:ATP-binding cassette, subfamily G (WHITE), member 2, SNQ2
MADTPDAATLYDEKQDNRRDVSGIDVVRATNEFNALSRSLSKHSDAKPLSSTTVASKDLEKADLDEAEQFDLREYLSSSNDANQQAGIKHKVGVFPFVGLFLD